MLADVPLFPLNLVLLPTELQPLHIFEPRYRELLRRCERTGEPFAVVLADDHGRREIGATAELVEVLERFEDGRSNILVRGGEPLRIVEQHDVHLYASADAEPLADTGGAAPDELQERALAAYDRLIAESPSTLQPEPPQRGERLSYELAGRLELDVDVKQELLEERDEPRRLERVERLLTEIHRGMAIAAEVQRRARRNGRVRTADEIAEQLGLGPL